MEKKKKKKRLYLSAVLPYVALAEAQQNGDNFYFIEWGSVLISIIWERLWTNRGIFIIT